MQTEDVKREVGKFYDEVGWQTETDGHYQNAQYEDLRPVSAEYIARCHARAGSHLAKSGQYLLDAGSGPVQYDAYLAYSAGYQQRVCLDLSHVALTEARKRLGERGFFVVADIAHLPFKPEAFDGIISLHTIHHLPAEEKKACYLGLYRCLKPGRSMVTVDGWNQHGLKRLTQWMVRKASQLKKGNPSNTAPTAAPASQAQVVGTWAVASEAGSHPAGTFVTKNNAAWFEETFNGVFPYEIRAWRSVSVSFLRAVIQPEWGGKFWLRVLYRLEEWSPHYFGKNGQYPLIVIRKPGRQQPA